MTIEIKLPDLGDGIDAGDVLEILVQEGDQIAVDQSIVEVETDKATVEVPSTHAGKVLQVHVSAGQSVSIGNPLITVEGVADEEVPDTTAAEGATPRSSVPSSSEAAKLAPSNPVAPVTESLPASQQDVSSPFESDVVAAGPAIRRFAREVGVDLSRVQGTGAGGRITREDVLVVVREANQATQAAVGVSPSTTAAVGTEHDAWGPVRHVPLTKIRKTIAAKMYESWSTIPRVTNFDDADVTQLEEMRQAAKPDYAKAGIKLTTMPFIIKSVAMALREHSEMNASLDLQNDRVIYKDYINVGIAVDTDRGLVVPSLRNVDRMSIPEISRALSELTEKVRTTSFSVDDLRGSTFTISNLGAIGGSYSTPIINPPEVGILLVGRSRKMPVVVDNTVHVRLMMPLSLSYDHRLVDGAIAARFLNDLISYLASPSRTLLAP